MEPAELIREYLLLGLRFDRIEQGYVDAFTGDPELQRLVANEPMPDPAVLSQQAEKLRQARERREQRESDEWVTQQWARRGSSW